MNILVSLDSGYLKPLKIMLNSLFLNNPEDSFVIYLMHSSITDQELDDLENYIVTRGSDLQVIKMDDQSFENAPVLMHYTKEMYYRLLAFQVLPQDLDRVLYLDPDILVLNPLRKLYETDLKGYLYAAASHGISNTGKVINQLRLNLDKIEAYYNSGVLLMNLKLQRETINPQVIFDFVLENKSKLVLPDQDVLNALYSSKIKGLDERLYNYDARHYGYYYIKSNGTCDMDYIINNTVILHFCGKKKPWKKDYSGKFHALFKHYEKQALR